MKKWTRFAALALALALLASLLPTVCVRAEAASEMNPTINDGILSWQPMDGATVYAVNWYIDDWTSGSGYITETSFDLQAAMDANLSCYTGEYIIRVVAYRSEGSYLCEEQVNFYYHSTVPCLNTPAVWFDGTTVCWTAVENADYYACDLLCSTSSTSFYGAPCVGCANTADTSAAFSAVINSDHYYMARVTAKAAPNGEINCKPSRKGYSGIVSGADLIAGFNNAPIQATVTPPVAGFHPVTTGTTDDLSLYKVTAVNYNLLNADGTEGLDMSSEETFEQGKTYRIWVRLTSVSHFQFTDDTTVAINGTPAVNHGVNMGGDAWFTVDMTAEKAHPYGDIPLTADYFPDPYFRQYLADKFNTNGNEVLEQSEIYNIRSLHLNVWGENYSNVASLEGVQYLPYMEAIYANHTKITGFDGTGLDDLTALDLSDCPLNSLNLRENACMRELYLADSSGELQEIDLSGMPELRILETYRSNISIMDISKNPHLVDAALYGEVTSNDYSKTFRIDRFHYLCTDGYDHNVTVAHFSEAFPDDCFRSLIQGHTDYNWDSNDNLSISEAKNITALDVGDEEEIRSLIGVELLPNLEFLAAFNNKLQSVDLRRNTKLNWLDLDNNKLGTLDVSHNTALETLYCQYNELTLLNLGNNNVLKSVYAYDNRLTELCLSGVPALEDLDVSMNRLTDLNLYSNRKLEVLNCYGNEITKLNISNNPNLISAYKGTRTEVTDSETGITICNYQDGNYNRLSINKDVTVYTDGYRNPFVDVAESDYFFNPVMWAYYHDPQVTAGIDETNFGPGNDCTRAQVVTFLYAAAGKPDFEMPDESFSDVAEGDWFYKPVMWALSLGITAGMGDGTFGATATCTRAQVVTFLYAAANRPEFEMPDSSFSDVIEGEWYYKPVMWAVKNGITSGIGDGLFGPYNTCTRAQIVTFLWAAEGRP